MIASICLEGGMGEAISIEGATDAEVFETYVVGDFLAPTLKTGQVVVLDGLGAHRTAKVRELIEGRGAELVFLPAYSPDLDPIEEAFSKIKSIVRKAGARTREALSTKSWGRRALGGHLGGRGGMVFALRLRATGSILMNTAVGAFAGVGPLAAAPFGGRYQGYPPGATRRACDLPLTASPAT